MWIASLPPDSPVKHVPCVSRESEQIKGAPVSHSTSHGRGVREQRSQSESLTLASLRTSERSCSRAETPPNSVTSRQREGTKSEADF